MEAVLTVGAEDRREGEGEDGMGIQQGLRPLMDPGGNGSSSGAWKGLSGLVGHWPGRLCARTVGGALPSALMAVGSRCFWATEVRVRPTPADSRALCDKQTQGDLCPQGPRAVMPGVRLSSSE